MADISKIKTPDGTVYDIKVRDTAESVVTFTSSDETDESSSEWTSVTPIISGETHKSIFAKMSQMFKNVRYLYKMLGTTDISAIGDGTVKGALSTLNSTINDIEDITSQFTIGPTITVVAFYVGIRNKHVYGYFRGSTSSDNTTVNDPRIFEIPSKYIPYGTKYTVAIPSTWDKNTIGIFNVFNELNGHFYGVFAAKAYTKDVSYAFSFDWEIR